MKKAILLPLAVLLPFLTSCVVVHVTESDSFSSGDLKATASASQNGAIPANLKVLEVDNRSGLIRVVGVEADTGEWSWQLTVRARTEELAQQAAQAAVCRAESEADTLRLVVTLPESKGGISFQSDLEIRAPKSVVLRTKNRYGPTEISDFQRDVTAANQGGALDIRNVRGEVKAQNSYATLKVNHSGPATLKNQSGLIEALNIQGALDAETSYASLVARDIGSSVRLRNQSGRIEVTRTAGNADLKTSYAQISAMEINGDATLMNQSGVINASNVSGQVKATTSYAALSIQAATGANIVCQNHSGSIQVQATSLTLTNLEARTSYAPLEIHLPAALKPVVTAETTYGKVESDFPVILNSASRNAASETPPDAPRVSLQNRSGGIRVIRD